LDTRDTFFSAESGDYFNSLLAAVLFENLLELGGDLRWQAAFDVLAGNKRHHFAVFEKRCTWARGRIPGRLTKRGGKGI
jgi:hypothetical protein